MTDYITYSTYFSILLTLISYEAGLLLKKRFNTPFFNPMLISMLISISFVSIFKIDINKYNEASKIYTYLLTPATVCLAIPLYEQYEKLRKNYIAILGGIIAGTVTCMTLVFVLCLLFKISHNEYVSLLPKSITTAIGIVISEEYGGIPAITVAMIVITGIIGNVFADVILKIFGVKNSIAKGVAIGTSSHALGTTKAIELGEVEGAMSGLSIAVAGLLTVILFSFYTILL